LHVGFAVAIGNRLVTAAIASMQAAFPLMTTLISETRKAALEIVAPPNPSSAPTYNFC